MVCLPLAHVRFLISEELPQRWKQLHEIPVQVGEERDPQVRLGRVAGDQAVRPRASTLAWASVLSC